MLWLQALRIRFCPHQPDDFPEGIQRCELCGFGPLVPSTDWAADLFADEQIF